MTNGGGFQVHLLDPAFTFDHDADVLGGDVMLDATDQALGSLLDKGGHLLYDHTAYLPPTFPVNVDFDASYRDCMAMLDGRAFQSIPYVGNTFQAVAQLHHLPPEMTYSGFDNVCVQEAPALHAPLDAFDTAISESQMTGLTLPIQPRYATTEDWERYRALITQLYRDKKKTLKEVKSIMTERHRFNATDKMYKKRINDWQLHKNCKASQKEEILRYIETNRKLGINLGEPMVNGRTIKMHLIQRHCKEKRKARSPSPNLADRTIMAANDRQPAKRARPRGAMCSASISFSRIEDPADYRNYENLLFQVDQYYNSKLENDPRKTWKAWQKSSSLDGQEVLYTFQDISYTCRFTEHKGVFDRFVLAKQCLLYDRPREVWRLVQEGAEMVRPSLLQERPGFLRSLLVYLSRSSSSRFSEVQVQLLHLMSNMAIIVHGEHHPISNMCRLLLTLHEKKDVIELAQRKLLDTFKHHLGENHRSSLLAQARLCKTMRRQKRWDEAERSLRDLIKTHERFDGRTHFSTRIVLFIWQPCTTSSTGTHKLKIPSWIVFSVASRVVQVIRST